MSASVTYEQQVEKPQAVSSAGVRSLLTPALLTTRGLAYHVCMLMLFCVLSSVYPCRFSSKRETAHSLILAPLIVPYWNYYFFLRCSLLALRQLKNTYYYDADYMLKISIIVFIFSVNPGFRTSTISIDFFFSSLSLK